MSRKRKEKENKYFFAATYHLESKKVTQYLESIRCRVTKEGKEEKRIILTRLLLKIFLWRDGAVSLKNMSSLKKYASELHASNRDIYFIQFRDSAANVLKLKGWSVFYVITLGGCKRSHSM